MSINLSYIIEKVNIKINISFKLIKVLIFQIKAFYHRHDDEEFATHDLFLWTNIDI